jgi:hypothetical protein
MGGEQLPDDRIETAGKAAVGCLVAIGCVLLIALIAAACVRIFVAIAFPG